MKVASGLVVMVMVMLNLTTVVDGEDLYDVLGVKYNDSPKDIKKVYRRLALKFHPDKQTPETKAEMEATFMKIAKAYRVLSDPERRKKYDLYGLVDDGAEFKDFNDAFSRAGVEDTFMNNIGLALLLGMAVLPVLLLAQSRKKKPVSRQREALKEKMAASSISGSVKRRGKGEAESDSAQSKTK